MAERWRDVAHIGHAELLTPTPEASLEYFTTLLGMTVVLEQHGSWYLRGYGDYEPYCLKLTASAAPGLGHLAVRAWSPEALARRVEWLKAAGAGGGWVEPEGGKGPAYEFADPDGHPVRIYYETSKYAPPAADRPAMKSNHQRYHGTGANVRRLEHVNLMARDVRACREFWADGFGLRTFEVIRRDDGSEDGAWLSSTVQGHEVIYVRDYLHGTGPSRSGRLHHLAFWVDSREEVLRAADLMNDAGVPIEAGPSRHIPIQGFYLYTREPGGNRIEVCSGGYLGFDPDDDPVVWTAAEYAAKPGWGARLPSTFRSYGTPPLGAPEEAVTADWPTPPQARVDLGMGKVAGLVAAVVVVLGIAVFAFLYAAGPSGQPGAASSPASTSSAKIVKVATSTKTYSMTAGGRGRSYEVIAPVSGLPKSAPVIVMLSGYGAPVSAEITRDQLVPYASSDQAEIVYPVAVQKSWNAIDCCGYAHAHNVDDMAFLKALVPAVDPGRTRPVYVVGYSNGARLAYRVACTEPGLFDAYVAVKGGPSPSCMASKPITIAQLASLDDPESAYNPPARSSKDPIPVTTLVARLQETDQCPAGHVVTHSGSMTLDTWSGCADGTRLAFATWTDGKHSFPRPPFSVPAAAQVIWSFCTNTPLAALP